MVFDWSINISVIIAIMGMGFGLVSAYYIIKSDVKGLDVRLTVAEISLRDQIGMNAKIVAEIGAVRQDVAVIRDRLEPPPVSPQTPSRGSST